MSFALPWGFGDTDEDLLAGVYYGHDHGAGGCRRMQDWFAMLCGNDELVGQTDPDTGCLIVGVRIEACGQSFSIAGMQNPAGVIHPIPGPVGSGARVVLSEDCQQP